LDSFAKSEANMFEKQSKFYYGVDKDLVKCNMRYIMNTMRSNYFFGFFTFTGPQAVGEVLMPKKKRV